MQMTIFGDTSDPIGRLHLTSVTTNETERVWAMRVRKWSSLLLLIVLVVVMAGCGNSQSNGESSASTAAKSQSTGASESNAASEKVKLTLWYWNGSIDDDLLGQVGAQFPNIELDAQKIGGDYRTKLLTVLSAGSGAPDIAGINADVATFFPNKDKFYNLLELGAADIAADYLDWKWKMGITSDGQFMVGFPMDTGPTALYYREDLFKAAGLPSDPADVAAQIKTWDDYRNAGKKFNDGKVFLTDNAWDVFNQYTSQLDQSFFDNDDNFIGDQPHITDGFNLAAGFYTDKLVAKVANWTPEWNAAANNGKFASFVGASWMKSTLEAAAPNTNGKWRVAPAPGGPGNNGGSFLSIPKQSKHPQEAFAVIKWLQNAENQANSYVTKGLFPSSIASFQDSKMNEPDEFFGGQNINEVFSSAAQGIKPVYLGINQNLTSPYNDELTNIEKSGKDPQKALADAIEATKKKLTQAAAK